MKARPYQAHAIEAVRGRFAAGDRSTLAVLATGLGKTVIFSHLAREASGRVLVLAHRDELIRQAAEKLREVTGEEAGVEKADERLPETALYKPRLVVSSVQTLQQEARRAKFDPSEFGLLITDEAHHAVASSYQSVFAHWMQNPACRHLGVTATPKRLDRLAMGRVYDSVAVNYGIEWAIQEGWLVPILQRAVVVEGLDFSSLPSKAGDFSKADLEKILSEEKVLHATARPTVEVAGDMPTLVFCVNVAHAKLMAAVLDRYKPGSAAALSGKTPPEERAATVARFKGGDLQFLCNCNLFLEGFDAPNVRAVVMARPTKSVSLYEQVLGRGTRPESGVVDRHAAGTAEQRRQAIRRSGKPDMLVLDFVGNSGRHRIVTAQDVLGGRYGEPVRQYARQLAEQKPAEVGELLGQAADELAYLQELADLERRRKIVADRAEYQAREVSPFAGGPRQVGGASAAPGEKATEKQVWFLVRRLGWKERHARELGRKQASAIIGKAREKGVA